MKYIIHSILDLQTNMSSLRLRLREVLKRIRCIIACCGSGITIENSQIDGKPKEQQK